MQTASAGMQIDKPNFTECAAPPARPPFQLDDDEDEASEGDGIQWSDTHGAHLDRL